MPVVWQLPRLRERIRVRGTALPHARDQRVALALHVAGDARVARLAHVRDDLTQELAKAQVAGHVGVAQQVVDRGVEQRAIEPVAEASSLDARALGPFIEKSLALVYALVPAHALVSAHALVPVNALARVERVMVAERGRCQGPSPARQVMRLAELVHDLDVLELCVRRADGGLELARDLGGHVAGSKVRVVHEIAVAEHILDDVYAIRGGLPAPREARHLAEQRPHLGPGAAQLVAVDAHIARAEVAHVPFVGHELSVVEKIAPDVPQDMP